LVQSVYESSLHEILAYYNVNAVRPRRARAIAITKRVIAVDSKRPGHIFWQAIHAGAVAAGNSSREIRWNGPPPRSILKADQYRGRFINQHVRRHRAAPVTGVAGPGGGAREQEKIPVAIFDSGIKTDKLLSYVPPTTIRVA